MLEVLDARLDVVHTIFCCVAGKWPHTVVFEVLRYTSAKPQKRANRKTQKAERARKREREVCGESSNRVANSAVFCTSSNEASGQRQC